MRSLVRVAAAALMIVGMSLVGATSAQASSPKWLSISLAGHNTCAIRTDHALFCWGLNDDGAVGDGTATSRSTPTRVGTSTSWKSVSVGDDFACALHASGSIYCWGDNHVGQIGLGTSGDEPVTSPKKVGKSTSWKSVHAGSAHTCALHKSGAIYCWGFNEVGQLGDGTTTDSYSPKKIGTSTSWKSVSPATNGYTTCAVHSGGTIYCWGDNEVGQVGDGTATERDTPKKVGKSTSWKTVNGGPAHTCATHTGGTIYCWGYNQDGEIGSGGFATQPVPLKIGTSTSWSSVSAGDSHTCARHSAGYIYCWGGNEKGQLGDGTVAGHATPKKAGTLKSWTSVTAGGDRTCAIASSGYAYCWGDNQYGELGNGTTTLDPTTSPTKITAVS